LLIIHPGGGLEYRIKQLNTYRYVDSNSSQIEPLAYPILFPFNDTGYSPVSGGIRLPQYISSRLLMPDPPVRHPVTDMPFTFRTPETQNENSDSMRTNRFQMFSRLGQYFLTETLTRSMNNKLEFISKNQDNLFGMKYDEDDVAAEDRDGDADDRGNADPERQSMNTGNKSFLPDSFTGGARHLKKLAVSALTVVSERGPPSAFITLTFNPQWPEVAEALLPGQTIYDRPDLQARIFHARLSAYLQNLKNGKYYKKDDGSPVKVLYVMRVSINKRYCFKYSI
jgi:hypothetical protein